MKVLHVLNYGWPWIDGYTARSIGLITAQRDHLSGVEVVVATSPFAPLAQGQDTQFESAAWSASQQISASPRGGQGPTALAPSWERPAMGLAPVTAKRFAAELQSIARRCGAQLIHVHHPHYVAGPALDTGATLGIPVVYELRCFNGNYDLGTMSPYRTLRGHWQNRLELRCARRASAVVTISNGLADTLRAGGVSEERLFIVRNSVDTQRFAVPGSDTRTSYAATSEADRHAGTRRTLHVGYATTFERIEALDTAVEAVKLALPALEAAGIDLTVTLAGTGRDYPRIAARVDALDLNDTVRLPGLVPYRDMPAFYRSLDLFLVPRGASVVTLDTTPLKPLEALASGLPLLVTDLPAMRELLDGRDDVRFTLPNATAMADALVSFARTPWPGTGRIESRAWSVEVQKYERVYEAALSQGPPPARSGGGHALGSGKTQSNGSDNSTPMLAVPGSRVRQGLRALRDKGMLSWAGVHDLQSHIVVCGFPRTGSTLLQLMVESCIAHVQTFEGEVTALDRACRDSNRQRLLLTKHPDDLLQMAAIDASALARDIQLRYILCQRDPRDILTSRHAAYTADRGYYVSPERFDALWQAFQTQRARDDVYVLPYERLISEPDTVQHELQAFTGWEKGASFSTFHERASTRLRDSMTDGALGGLRPLDSAGTQRWRENAHHQRLLEVLSTYPALAQACIDLGYETNDDWIAELSPDRADLIISKTDAAVGARV